MKKIFPWLQRLLPNYCLLCKDVTHSKLALCAYCITLLPWRTECYCQICGLPLQTSGTCGSCLKNSPAFDRVIAPFAYRAPIDHFIYQLKFQHKLIYAHLLGNLLADYIRTQYEFLPEVLLPVPLHRQRIRQRGFNQAGEIAKVVAKHLHIPFSQNYLLRDKRTHAQTYLKAKGRNKNVKNAFKIKKKIEFRHIALIDDVITTGATLRQVSLALKKAGVERIDICCVARAETR